MHLRLSELHQHTISGAEAQSIVSKCVHCGFCNATCPTYQLLGDERDGPRGRIYLIKQMFEGEPVSQRTQTHLDRCLTCRACETTCPSGVEYGRLLDLGRELAVEKIPRGAWDRLRRRLVRAVMLRRWLFAALLRVGHLLRPGLPAVLKAKIPPRADPGTWPALRHARRVLLPAGCVQPALAPRIDAAAARVLDRLGISVQRVAGGGCCGALSHHLDATAEAKALIRRNIDAWWPHIEAGAEAVLSTASGCGVMLKDYGRLLREDPAYAQKAERVSVLVRDIAEIVYAEMPEHSVAPARAQRVVFQSPCTLQHGLRLGGVVETILRRAGFEPAWVADAHLCCGSAGSYSILQPTIATQLRDNKLQALQTGQPELILSANIGCLTHLQSGTTTPVRHWIELLDEAAADVPQPARPG